MNKSKQTCDDNAPKLTERRLSKVKEFPILAALILVCLAVSLASPYFLKMQNIFNVLRQFSIIGILAVGEALVIITGGIDLSIGYLLGLCGVITALLAKANVPAPIIFVTIIALGATISLMSALLVTKANINPFIVTLGMMNICRGVSLLITGGMAIQYKSAITVLGSGYIGPVPIPVIVMFVVVLIGILFTKYTQPGRNVYAVGSNMRAAKLSGVKIDAIRIMTFVITGALCGLCGMIQSGTLKTAEPLAGGGYEMDVIAAAVIGGVSMSGGEGTVLGVIIGAAIMGVLKNSFVLLNVSAYWQIVVLGIVTILAVAVDALKTKRTAR